MKNKRVYKYYLTSLLDIAIALLLSFILLSVCKSVSNYLYVYKESKLASYLWGIWRKLKYHMFGDYMYFILAFLVFAIVYFFITYKKNKSLSDIISETEIMAKGDLNRVIKSKATGDIKNLERNINNILDQLKERTIKERNAQKTKNDLVTNVSHDLRTPLTSIMGYLELIENDKYKDEVVLKYYIDIAYEKAKSLNLLINDLFELTKMQNNVINLNKSDINLVELLGQVVAYFECQFKNANMESRIKFLNEKLIINADAEKLVRAFENLLSNAIKYGKDGYYVDVVTKLEDNKAVIQIINYGQSISSIDLPYVFDRFYRVEKSRNSSIGGSGLGLAITKNIIELHGGTIEAYSDNNKTIFEIKLPVEKIV